MYALFSSVFHQFILIVMQPKTNYFKTFGIDQVFPEKYPGTGRNVVYISSFRSRKK